MPPVRPTFAHVDLDALKANFRAVRGHVRAGETHRPGVIAVVKANAYGHGAAPVGRALQDAGAEMLACADIEEGVLLRESGVTIPILIFGALSVSDVSGVFTHRLTPTISTPAAGRALQAAAAERSERLRCHLKIDTGMNRLGLRFDNLRNTLPEILSSPNLVIDALYTHFATADDPESELFDLQQARFAAARQNVGALGLRPRVLHAANSAALLRDDRAWFDYVRPGLLLYGITPPAMQSAIALRPVMTLRSRIVAVKGMRAGETLGYGARFKAESASRVAVIPAGYADGLDCRLAGRGFVLVRGRRAPIVGSVCMDMLMVDVTGMEAETGDEAVLLGSQGTESIGAEDMAAAIGTIPYEILCRIGSRIERIYESHQVTK
jgi:alanine racemase